MTSSALTGRVTVGDAAARKATVTVVLRSTQTTRSAATNARGTYWLGALTPGQYDVTFSRAGLTSLTRPVTIELGRVARADAKLEPSEDEESVTSTATTVSVANTTAVTTHFTAEELERIPLRRDVRGAEALSPVLRESETIVDDTAMFYPSLLGEDALEEVTIVRGAQPIELDRFGSSVILARTRSGVDELYLSLRGTHSTDDGGGFVLESTSGGPILPERLWFFAAGWGGDATDVRLQKLRGYAAKITAQAGASHHLIASHIDADARFSDADARFARHLGSSASSLRYTGVLHQRLTAEAIVSRSNGDSEDIHLRDDAVAVKASYRIADHVISAGGSHGNQWTTRDVDALFLSDRWASGRWTVDAGVRHDDEHTMTRVALAFDLRSSRAATRSSPAGASISTRRARHNRGHHHRDIRARPCCAWPASATRLPWNHREPRASICSTTKARGRWIRCRPTCAIACSIASKLAEATSTRAPTMRDCSIFRFRNIWPASASACSFPSPATSSRRWPSSATTPSTGPPTSASATRSPSAASRSPLPPTPRTYSTRPSSVSGRAFVVNRTFGRF